MELVSLIGMFAVVCASSVPVDYSRTAKCVTKSEATAFVTDFASVWFCESFLLPLTSHQLSDASLEGTAPNSGAVTNIIATLDFTLKSDSAISVITVFGNGPGMSVFSSNHHSASS